MADERKNMETLMIRFFSAPAAGHGSWEIFEIGPIGVGKRCLSVFHDYSVSRHMGEQAAATLVLACSLPGGLDRAVELLVAELARVS